MKTEYQGRHFEPKSQKVCRDIWEHISEDLELAYKYSDDIWNRSEIGSSIECRAARLRMAIGGTNARLDLPTHRGIRQ